MPRGVFTSSWSYCSNKRRFRDPGASTSQRSRLSEIEVLHQRLAQREAVIESHLGVRMDSRVSTSRAPPPPPPPQEGEDGSN
ncbi:hypothetical protein Sjap_008861 [Stephania japonica]|uniref:Uncharacterized protein n=1 Tax=Stephania japonica TaxID=461633 RepID=A0AAP0JQH5_9MAGN